MMWCEAILNTRRCDCSGVVHNELLVTEVLGMAEADRGGKIIQCSFGRISLILLFRVPLLVEFQLNFILTMKIRCLVVI